MMSVEQMRLWWFGCFRCAVHGADRGPTAHGSLLSYPNKDSLIEQLLLASLVKLGDFPLVWGLISCL